MAFISAKPKRAERLPVAFKVELMLVDGSSVLLSTHNISDTGCFVLTGTTPPPKIGEVVKVRLHGNLGCGEEPPTLAMRVMRVAENGVGLQFIDDAAP